MEYAKMITVSILTFAILLLGYAGIANAAASCDPSVGAGGLPFPTWYEYLPGEVVDGTCEIKTEGLGGTAVLLIIMALFDIVLFLAGVAAVIFVVFGGFKLLTSAGEPNKIAAARTTILNSLVGLAIALVAAQVVGFIAGRLV